jgi:hypothetical protein
VSGEIPGTFGRDFRRALFARTSSVAAIKLGIVLLDVAYTMDALTFEAGRRYLQRETLLTDGRDYDRATNDLAAAGLARADTRPGVRTRWTLGLALAGTDRPPAEWPVKWPVEWPVETDHDPGSDPRLHHDEDQKDVTGLADEARDVAREEDVVDVADAPPPGDPLTAPQDETSTPAGVEDGRRDVRGDSGAEVDEGYFASKLAELSRSVLKDVEP